MARKLIRREDLVYPDLSYQIIGILFDAYNKLGYGHDERVYQRAVAEGLRNAQLQFQEQVYAPILYRNKRIGSNYFDFLLENKVVLEIKRGDRFIRAHIDQVYGYLVTSKLKLGILAYFAPRNLHFKRIVNM